MTSRRASRMCRPRRSTIPTPRTARIASNAHRIDIPGGALSRCSATVNWGHLGSKCRRVRCLHPAASLSYSPLRLRERGQGGLVGHAPALDEGGRRSVLRHARAGVNQDLISVRAGRAVVRSVSDVDDVRAGRDGGSTRLPNPPLPGSARRPRGRRCTSCTASSRGDRNAASVTKNRAGATLKSVRRRLAIAALEPNESERAIRRAPSVRECHMTNWCARPFGRVP